MKLVSIQLLVSAYSLLCLGVICLAYMLRRHVYPLYVLRKHTGRVLFGRWFLVTILAASGLTVGIWVVYSDFISIVASKNTIVLGYCWPRTPIVLPADKDLKAKLERFGNGQRVRIVIVSGSKVYKSTTIRRTTGEQAMKLFEARNNAHQSDFDVNW